MLGALKNFVMFNKNFYPTPNHIASLMCSMSDLSNKVILEPHGGKGDLIESIKTFLPKEILTCEKSDDLAVICSQKADRFLKHDFLQVTKEEISHVDVIIANPPFDKADEHILHMWDIAPDGCEIISLCNWNTLDNRYSLKRESLGYIIQNNGTKENLKDCFSDAERKTDVEVGLIHLFKPKTGEGEFDGYFDMEEEFVHQENGIIKHDEITEIVNRYVGAVKYWDTVVEAQTRMNQLIAPISNYQHQISFSVSVGNSNNYTEINRDTFKKELQKGAWKSVFAKFNMKKYTTEKTMADINKFVEKQSQIPFTVKNIYKMIDIIVGTHGNTMNKVILEVFDWLTEHHFDNRLSLEGWKTNSEYVVNEKFIAPYCGVSFGWSGQPEIRYSSSHRMDDLTKALCYLTGKNYDDFTDISTCFKSEAVEAEEVSDDDNEDGYSYLTKTQRIGGDNWGRNQTIKKIRYKFKEDSDYHYYISNGYSGTVERYKKFGKWYDFGFFEIKVFKKGTLHAKFKDKKVWELFNQSAAKAKGFQLASKFTSSYRQKGSGIVKS